ncbi:DUF4893 domain-containing protein [Kaistia dalseonensis]|uniref:DUF4893 domain-containing protein n=1 Tax=Kaistia dalseonensis TaxID=410840 RepID=A0ABU0H171_9HYPH|nr:DUF4893 domain-containing protein [Kaistia dalseonensis]MCX5493497.1 DUF4893 domain-containing protein [Kaistia dalseonensis]MDQ0436057.1 hypothetical protein [Kaistia dalseonensis]
MMKPIRARLSLLALLLPMVLPGAAHADGTMADRTLTKADKARLAQYETAKKAAVATARQGGGTADVATLDTLLAAKAEPILGVDIRGDYRCRTIKLGGEPPLTVYGWFNCRIDEDDIGYRLTKTSGSQRFAGHFIDEAKTRLIYYGAAHYADEKPKRYGTAADRDQVGYFFRTGPGRYRLDLPLPQYESQFDIIELQKR